MRGEGVHGPRPKSCAQARPDDPNGVPDDPGIVDPYDPDGVPDDPASGVFGAVIRTIRGSARMIRLSRDDPARRPDVRLQLSSRSVFFSFLPSSLPCLALVLGFSMVILVVPECMQGPCMR